MEQLQHTAIDVKWFCHLSDLFYSLGYFSALSFQSHGFSQVIILVFKAEMWDFKTILPPKHWQQLKASVIAVLFKEKKKKVRYSRWLSGLASAIVLLLIAPVQLSQLLLSHPPSLVGFGWAAGACGLGWLGAVAAWGRTLQEVLRYATLQVLHGRRGCHADDPGVLEGLTGVKSLTGIHC